MNRSFDPKYYDQSKHEKEFIIKKMNKNLK